MILGTFQAVIRVDFRGIWSGNERALSYFFPFRVLSPFLLSLQIALFVIVVAASVVVFAFDFCPLFSSLLLQ